MAKLVLLLTDGSTIDVPLRRERTVIGRRADNDICLPNPAVSGEHAVVVTILEDSFLEDLGSTNGTLVNGRSITKHFLRDRDHIDVGRHKLVYCVDENAVLPRDTVKAAAARASVGDLGELVQLAKPIVRPRQPRASMARAHPEAAPPPPTRDESTLKITALVDAALSEAADGSVSASAVADSAPEVRLVASLKIVSGPSAGRVIQLTEDATTMGRAGVQVSAVVRVGEAYALESIEGPRPLLNGVVLADVKGPLTSGDIIEVAGTRLEFLGPPMHDTESGPVAAGLELGGTVDHPVDSAA